jgi:long-subunit acyl-CoA synthetase (AMP-forming)
MRNKTLTILILEEWLLIPRELWEGIVQLAAGLQALGLIRGEKVCAVRDMSASWPNTG